MSTQEEEFSNPAAKDPRINARNYQLELCERAVKENIIVYLGTGCGKTRIAVLLIHELGHLIRKPEKRVCVFLAPTIHLVQQQAMVIKDSTNFKVGCYAGHSRRVRNHSDWEKEIDDHEVLVMTPQILLHNLGHCFIRMELIALLIFDECHHAQLQNRHPYAQIMKEFYRGNTSKCPRIFGMTASPIVGKGGSDLSNYAKSINSLETLLNAKVCTVEETEELENLVAYPNVKIYDYGRGNGSSSCIETYKKELAEIQERCMSITREKIKDPKELRKNMKLLWRVHENVLFCLENLGIWGAKQAVSILSSDDYPEHSEIVETEVSTNDNSTDLYLKQTASVFNMDFLTDGSGGKPSDLLALEEPFFSKKLLALIQILHTKGVEDDMKCIVFVKRVIVARALAFILGNLELLSFWKCEVLVGCHSRWKNMSRKMLDGNVAKFRSGKLNLLVATSVAEEGLDVQTCCIVIRFDLPETLASYIQSRGRARMQHSEFVFLVDRGKQHDLNILNDFKSNEDSMTKEILCRSSSETFDVLESKSYIVESTGASISSVSSVDLLHHYCSKLPRDEYFIPKPHFFFIDDLSGTVCQIFLPSYAPLCQVNGPASPSKDEAKRNACLKACSQLHSLGCLTDYLLPVEADEKEEVAHFSDSDSEDEILRGDFHEMLVPAVLKSPWSSTEIPLTLNAYFIEFIPVPDDRLYREFGLFVKTPLPEEARTMNVDLHLARGRIVKTRLIPSGIAEFDNIQIENGQNFQEMFLKVILDRSELFADFVHLGMNISLFSSSTFYLLLPVIRHGNDGGLSIDWGTVSGCLSSPLFRCPTDTTTNGVSDVDDSLVLLNGPIRTIDVQNSLVFTPHKKAFYFIDDILYDLNGDSPLKDSNYAAYYLKKFGITLSYKHQPLLKAKQLSNLCNLLHNRSQGQKEYCESPEYFVQLPPEVCSLKIVGFSKDIGSSLSLLPSLMHRLENLLVAIELKERFSSSFKEGSEITAGHVLEALTTEKCLERFSLERLEVLGDSFLKYVVSSHLFLSNESLDEGQLTRRRSSIVNNENLCQLAIRSNLQVICNEDTKRNIHVRYDSKKMQNGADIDGVKCNKHHHWLQRKTIADVVEALVGAFIVESGFKAATSFLRWLGIKVDFDLSALTKSFTASKSNLSRINDIDIESLEKMLHYQFVHKGLLRQAFIHPSYDKHFGGCYQRLEFLGDAVLDYWITSYLYSGYPDLKPGELTDLRSIIVNNISFAHIALQKSFHLYLLSSSSSLSNDINEFVNLCSSEKCSCNKKKCPKVLGDLVESCAGAILLDSGFNLQTVWKIVFSFLDPVKIVSRSCLKRSPIRELQELCQNYNFKLSFPYTLKNMEIFILEAVVDANDVRITGSVTHHSRKVAKRLAAEEVLSKLRVKGIRNKNKSPEEILRSSHKQEAKLLGFDETWTKIHTINTLNLENPHFLEGSSSMSNHSASSKAYEEVADMASSFSVVNTPSNKTHYLGPREASSSGSTIAFHVEPYGKEPSLPPMSRDSGLSETGVADRISLKRTAGSLHQGFARSRLHQICALNSWNLPSYECCEEEGPSHLKLFTYKVRVNIEEATPLVLECFSNPMSTKKAAADSAASGALWFLTHMDVC